MKKFVVGTMVVVLGVASALAVTPKPEGRAFIYYLFQSLEQVELEGKITGFGFLNGKLVVELEGEKGGYVFFPFQLMREKNIMLKVNEDLKVIGRKLIVGEYSVVIPEKITYGGNEYDIVKLMKKAKMKRPGMRRPPFRMMFTPPTGGYPRGKVPFGAPMRNMGW